MHWRLLGQSKDALRLPCPCREYYPAPAGEARKGKALINVQGLRESLNLTQEEFAKRFHIPLRNVQMWEQHRRSPTATAITLLRMIEADANGVLGILALLEKDDESTA